MALTGGTWAVAELVSREGLPAWVTEIKAGESALSLPEADMPPQVRAWLDSLDQLPTERTVMRGLTFKEARRVRVARLQQIVSWCGSWPPWLLNELYGLECIPIEAVVGPRRVAGI